MQNYSGTMSTIVGLQPCLSFFLACLSIYVCLCLLSISLSVCLFISKPVNLCISLSVCPSVEGRQWMMVCNSLKTLLDSLEPVYLLVCLTVGLNTICLLSVFLSLLISVSMCTCHLFYQSLTLSVSLQPFYLSLCQSIFRVGVDR